MTENFDFLKQEGKNRNLAFDYALGACILGLIPISNILTLKLIIAIGLIVKMLWDIGKNWQFPKEQDILAILGYVFSILGAFAMTLMAWLTLVTLGLFLPYISSFKFAAALFTVTWMLGQSTNQFYASGYKRLIRRNENEI